jgi:hypothetical protein
MTKVELTKDTTIRAVTAGAAIGVIGLVLARAPQHRADKLPFVGDFIPFKVDAVNAIYWGPLVLTVVALVTLYFAQKAAGESRTIDKTDLFVGRILFFVFAVACVLLVMQTFLISGPAEFCPGRPNLRLLWTWRTDFVRVTHCMSGTEAMNATAPYYNLWIGGDAWAEIGLGGLTCFLLWRSWQRWSLVGNSVRP